MDYNGNLTAGSVNQTYHYYTYLRWTEVFLNFAEAGNEAWGPDQDPNGYGFTPKDVVRKTRERGGIIKDDLFMKYYVTNIEALRQLIKDERRIELSFEGHRFWDIRRWGDVEIMKQPVSAMFITDSTKVHEVREVEQRLYEDHMIYGPVPYLETLKYDIVQNEGWN